MTEKATIVSYFHLSFLSCYGKLPKEEWPSLQSINPNNESQVKRAIHILISYSENRSTWKTTKDCLRNSLKYFLNKGRFPIERVFDLGDPIFDLPDNPIDYYRWAWEVMFPGEDWQTMKLDQYVEKNVM